MNTKVFGPYFNGDEEVFGDPVVIHRRLWAQLQGRPNDYFDLIRQHEAEPVKSAQAAESVEMAVRHAFSMIPFDPATGQGATQEDCFAALNLFLAYKDEKKVSGSGSQT